jgi:hypothetical protein
VIREWLAEDGRVVRFDDALEVIDYRDSFNVIVEGPRQATAQEVQEFKARFPEATEAEILKRQQVLNGLDQLILSLRAANADGTISQAEFAAGAPLTISVLTQFSQYGKIDDEVAFKVIVALINLAQATTYIAQGLNQGLLAALAQQQEIRSDLDDLITRLEDNGTIQ